MESCQVQAVGVVRPYVAWMSVSGVFRAVSLYTTRDQVGWYGSSMDAPQRREKRERESALSFLYLYFSRSLYR